MEVDLEHINADWLRGLRDGVMASGKHIINFRNGLYELADDEGRAQDERAQLGLSMIDHCIDEINRLLDTCNENVKEKEAYDEDRHK